MPSDHFIAVDGLRIHYLDWATRGRQPLVLLCKTVIARHSVPWQSRESPGLRRRCDSRTDSHRSQQTTPQGWDAVWSITSK